MKEIEAMNKTARAIKNAVVPRYVMSIAKTSDTILDFGAGPQIYHTLLLREKGFNVTAYECGENINILHDKTALDRTYDIVYASNVINVQPNMYILLMTLDQIKNATNHYGIAIINYAREPRKMNLSTEEMKDVVGDYFKYIEPVGGTKAWPIWKCSNFKKG